VTNPPEREADRPDRLCLLRRRDQKVVATLVALAGLAILGWRWHYGRADRLIEWDEADVRTVRFTVDVNKASWPELIQLPEIGETLARRIVENRQAEGPFRSPEDLTRVHGIGEKTLAQMRPFLSSESWPDDISQRDAGP